MLQGADGADITEVERVAAIVEIEDRRIITEVYASGIIVKMLVGVTTLRLLGLQVDSLTSKLRKAPLSPLQSQRAPDTG